MLESTTVSTPSPLPMEMRCNHSWNHLSITRTPKNDMASVSDDIVNAKTVPSLWTDCISCPDLLSGRLMIFLMYKHCKGDDQKLIWRKWRRELMTSFLEANCRLLKILGFRCFVSMVRVCCSRVEIRLKYYFLTSF